MKYFSEFQLPPTNGTGYFFSSGTNDFAPVSEGRGGFIC
jgi:hypothetical protein